MATSNPPPHLDFDAIIIGAGMSGLYQLYRLRELGMRVHVFEAGTNVGGTWYWNRYPGARFEFGELFLRLLILQGVAGGMGLVRAFRGPAGETLRYLNHVADKFDLRRDITFKSRVAAARYDEDSQGWRISHWRTEATSAPAS